MSGKIGIWRRILLWFSHDAALENFRSSLCIHGIPYTGICEQCELDVKL